MFGTFVQSTYLCDTKNDEYLNVLRIDLELVLSQLDDPIYDLYNAHYTYKDGVRHTLNSILHRLGHDHLNDVLHENKSKMETDERDLSQVLSE